MAHESNQEARHNRGKPDNDEPEVRLEPVMIRAYHERCKGATAFFRNRPFLNELTRLLLAVCGSECRVLVHAASIGAEPYSLALWWLYKANAPSITLTIQATDINASFLEVARCGVYPLEILEGMTPEERSWFDIRQDGVHIPQKARDMLTFLPAMSFVDGNPGNCYDAILVMNALTYVTPQQQFTAIQNIASQARHILALTAFHPDSIRRDLQTVGFRPHLGQIEDIHSAWGDRLTDRPVDSATSEYSWKLPPFNSAAEDYEFRYCSLFLRSSPFFEVGQMKPELQEAVDELVRFAVERHQAGDIPRAQALYGKAIELCPTHPGALHNLGLIYLERGDISSAALLLSEAVRQRPAEATFNYNYALALQQQGNLTQALRYYNLALKNKPAYREAWENRGVVLQDLEQYDDAIASYRQALELGPNSLVANRNLGNALRVVGKLDEALIHYRNAIGRLPMNAEIVFGYGATLITHGNFAEGWPRYEWRFWSPEFLQNNPLYRVPLPHWDGSELSDKSILIYGEQGIGDEIMFASCLQDLIKSARKVTLLCEPRLVPLFSRSFANLTVVAKSGEHPPHDQADIWLADYCYALGSLPGQFRRSEQSFPATPYLVADPQAADRWKERLTGLGQGLKIGISWCGGAEARARNARSIALARLAPLFDHAGATFVNAQYGNHTDEIEAFNTATQHPLVSFPEVDPLHDMDGFAAFMSALDLVITVDNSTAHLAGALGIPTWLLLPAHADWRWLKGRENTPWYQSVRIFWQERHVTAAWDEVIARVATELHDVRCINTSRNCAVGINSIASEPCTNPSQVKPLVLLLNDTSYWYHWGCTLTSLALHEGLRAKGYWVDSIPITTFNTLEPLPSCIEDFDSLTFFQRFSEAHPDFIDRIECCDCVVINGEGTLHGLSHSALALLYAAYATKRWLNKDIRIVNHSCYPETGENSDNGLAKQIYKKVYDVLDYVSIREHLSAQVMESSGIRVVESFDCLPLYLIRHRSSPRASAKAVKRVVMAGSVALTPSTIDSMVKLANFTISCGYELQILVGANAHLANDDLQFINTLQGKIKGKYALVTAHSESAWLDAIAGAALLISGRFHHTMAAAFLGTPVAVAASNTLKMEGLLDRLQLSPEIVWLNTDKPSDAMEKIGKLLQHPESGLVKPSVLSELRDLAELNFRGLPTHEAQL